MNLSASFLGRAAGFAAAALLGDVAFAASAATPSSGSAAAPAAAAATTATPAATMASRGKEADAFPVYDNFIKFSGYIPSLDGSEEAFQARTQKVKDGALGIEDMSYLYDVGENTALQIDGKALAGQNDYLLQVRLTKEEVGSFEVGYKTFRTYYDGAGGFFPLNNAWITLYPRDLHVDRGEFFVRGTVALPEKPAFTFSYSHGTRDGTKDSTIWGDTDFTGIPIYSSSSLNPVSANRKIVPAYLKLDEEYDRWNLGARHTFGNTTVFLSVSGDNYDNNNIRSVDRYPGEVKPFPAIPSNPPVLVPPEKANNQNKGTDQLGVVEDAITIAGRFETAFSSNYIFFAGLEYHKADQDLSATRLVTGSLSTATGVVAPVGAFTSGGRPPYSYTGVGDMDLEIWTGNIGLRCRPMPDLLLDVALKGEDLSAVGHNDVVYIANLVNQNTGAISEQRVPTPQASDVSDTLWTPQIDLRYTGINRLALFLLWDQRTADADEYKRSGGISTSGTTIVANSSTSTENVKESHSNLKIGGNWNVSSKLELRGEFFQKDHENNFDGYGVSAGDYYDLNYDTYGFRGSAILRPTPTLSFTTRYVYTKGDGTVAAEGYVEGDSNDTTRHDIGETIDWTPSRSIYLQLNANVVYDTTSTAYPRAGGSANDVLHNADNNFWNGSFITGFVLTPRTNAEFQATYYEADNYNAAVAYSTTPYGMGVRDYSVTAGVKHKFSDRMVGEAKLGYLDSDSATTGGNSSYNGLVGYVSLTCRL